MDRDSGDEFMDYLRSSLRTAAGREVLAGRVGGWASTINGLAKRNASRDLTTFAAEVSAVRGAILAATDETAQDRVARRVAVIVLSLVPHAEHAARGADLVRRASRTLELARARGVLVRV